MDTTGVCWTNGCGRIVPMMKIFAMSDCASVSGQNTITYRSPLPGDLVAVKEAKLSLGFNQIEYPINVHDGLLGINSVFITDITQIENYRSLIDSIPEQGTGSFMCSVQIEMLGYCGGENNTDSDRYVSRTDSLVCEPDMIHALHEDQSFGNVFNNAIIASQRDRRFLSIWVMGCKRKGLEDKDRDTDENTNTLATFIGLYQVDKTTYGSYTTNLYRQRMKNLEDDGLLSGNAYRFAYQLKNHFRFSLIPINANSIPTDHKHVVSLYHKELIACTRQDLPRHLDERQFIQDPSLTIEDNVCSSFFKDNNEINDEMLQTPYFIHCSYQESITQSSSAFLRREMSLALLTLMGVLNSKENEELEDLFKRQIQAIHNFSHTQRHLRSLLGDCVCSYTKIKEMYMSLIPSAMLISTPHHENTVSFMKEECIGRTFKIDDMGVDGLDMLFKHQVESWNENPDLVQVVDNGTAIHYGPFGSSSSRKGVKMWNNLDHLSNLFPEVEHLKKKMLEAARIATDQAPDAELIYYANCLANVLPMEKHPAPQVPHCDVTPWKRNKSVNKDTGHSNAVIFFAPISNDGSIVCVWPLSCNKDEDKPLMDMKFVYTPRGYGTIYNAAVFHAGTAKFGKETVLCKHPWIQKESPMYPLFRSMTNSRMQVFILPESMGPCRTDVTYHTKEHLIKESFDEDAWKKVVYNLCDGDVSSYTCYDEVIMYP